MYVNFSWYSIPFKRDQKSRVNLHLKALIGEYSRLDDLSTKQAGNEFIPISSTD